MTDIALAQARARQAQHVQQAQQQRPMEQVGYATKVRIEPNEKGKARIDAEVAAAIARGDKPPEDFFLGPDERGDIVAAGFFRVIRRETPGGLALPGGAEAVIDIPDREISRRPYSEINAFVMEAFRGSDG